MANTRVKELMEMLKAETDPDKIQILKFDLAEARGQKDKGVRKKGGGGYMMDDQNKKVRKASQGAYGGSKYDGDEVMAAKACKGTGAAIRGTKFVGVR